MSLALQVQVSPADVKGGHSCRSATCDPLRRHTVKLGPAPQPSRKRLMVNDGVPDRRTSSGRRPMIRRFAEREAEPGSGCGATRLFFAAIPANDRDRTAQQCQGTHCLTRVNLRRRYSAVIVLLIVVPLIVPRFVIVRLIDTAGGEGEVCRERQ